MKVFLVTVFILGALFIVAFTIQRYGAVMIPHSPQPIFGEVPETKGLLIKPGQSVRFGPLVPAGGHIRYDVNSAMAVSTGVVEISGTWPDTAACYEQQIFSTVKDCLVTPTAQQWIFVADSRNASYVLGGLLGGNQQATQDNRVTLVIYHWGCVRNCPAGY